MRNISFMLTKRQFRDGSKDVTRRLAWWNAKPGDVMMGCEKCQGLGPGGKIVRMGIIKLVTARPEPLRAMLDDETYGREECRREGFPDMTPAEFVKFFCRNHEKCTAASTVMRLEFVKLDLPTSGLNQGEILEWPNQSTRQNLTSQTKA